MRRTLILLGVMLLVVSGLGDSVFAGQGVTPVISDGVAWYNAADWGVNGKGWADTVSYYDRLPAKAKDVVRPEVWSRSLTSAGMYIEFETDSTTISARWRLTSANLAMDHMAATGVSGVDLYVLNDAGKWQWLAVGKPISYPTSEATLISGLIPGYRKYRLYLPLYNGVTSVEIGVSSEAKFSPVPPSDEKPIVFYGTSITQGQAASRPGMAYTAILGRRLNAPIINLGFSGNARMEPEIAELLTELDASIYVLDPFPNMDAGLINANFERFITILREAKPTTPIVIVEDREFAHTPYVRARQIHYALTRTNLRAAYNRLVESGMEGLYLVPRDNLFGDDYDGTVDASHPTDLGFSRYSDVLEPILRSILEQLDRD